MQSLSKAIAEGDAKLGGVVRRREPTFVVGARDARPDLVVGHDAKVTPMRIAIGGRSLSIGGLLRYARDVYFPEYTHGPLDERVATALDRLAGEGWVHVYAAGFRQCELCGNARDSRNVLVPHGEILYVAPAMTAHYMRQHQYLPPAEFNAAVLACPDPESDAYYAELRRFVVDLSSRHFTMTGADFDRYAGEHRERRAEARAKREAAAKRKGFTWD